MKNEVYMINLNEYESIRTQMKHTLIVLEFKNFIGNKDIITNIYRVQVYKSIMTRYFTIGFIDFMLKGKSFL